MDSLKLTEADVSLSFSNKMAFWVGASAAETRCGAAVMNAAAAMSIPIIYFFMSCSFYLIVVGGNTVGTSLK